MITADNVFQVYSGKLGCMCGCNGTYTDSDKAKKSALTRILKTDYIVQLWDKDSDDVMGCLFHMTGTRNNVVYLRKGTVLTPEMLRRVAA